MRATARKERSKFLKSEMRLRLLPRKSAMVAKPFESIQLRKAVAEILDDAESVVHHRGADLQAGAPSSRNSAASRQVEIPPMPEIGLRGARDHLVGAKRGEHIQCDRFDGRSGIAAVTAFAADAGRDFESVEIDADDRVERVDQRERIGAAGESGARGQHDVGDVRRELDDDRECARPP